MPGGAYLVISLKGIDRLRSSLFFALPAQTRPTLKAGGEVSILDFHRAAAAGSGDKYGISAGIEFRLVENARGRLNRRQWESNLGSGAAGGVRGLAAGGL